MSKRYRCPSCGAVYTANVYRLLERRVYTKDERGNHHSKEAICEECGSGFVTDGWSLDDELVIESPYGTETTCHVTTLALTVGHGNNHDEFFETRISDVGSDAYRRYTTKTDAIEGHDEAVERLLNREYHYEPNSWEFFLEDDT